MNPGMTTAEAIALGVTIIVACIFSCYVGAWSAEINCKLAHTAPGRPYARAIR